VQGQSSRGGKSPPIVADGKQLRDRGVARAIEANPLSVLRLQIQILEAVHDRKRITIDDVTDAEGITGKFAARGPWRGAAISALVSLRLIRSDGWAPSHRPRRHHGWNRVFVAVNPARLPAAIAELKSQLAALRQGVGQ
jgi:hypothetical protein